MNTKDKQVITESIENNDWETMRPLLENSRITGLSTDMMLK